MATDGEMLASTQAAIKQITEGAQEYQLANGHRVKKADLAALQEREQSLLARVANAGGSTFKPICFGGFS